MIATNPYVQFGCTGQGSPIGMRMCFCAIQVVIDGHDRFNLTMDEQDSPVPAVVALVPTDPDWTPIFQVSNQVVLYNPTSHALSIRQSSNLPQRPPRPCPYCKQPLPLDFERDTEYEDPTGSLGSDDPAMHTRASNYFQLLAIANEVSSRPNTPPPIAESSQQSRNGRSIPIETMAEGYFKAFFQEECKLGMGANGSVFLCQVCLPYYYLYVPRSQLPLAHAGRESVG
jgi:hypothetical protein